MLIISERRSLRPSAAAPLARQWLAAAFMMVASAHAALAQSRDQGWEHWGGDAGGTRFSSLNQITPGNVDRLIRAWTYRTGDLDHRIAAVAGRIKFEATPLLIADSLILCTPFNEVIALDPGTGAQKWRFDPKLSDNQRPANRYTCRGVAHWTDESAPPHAACRSRIFTGTNDARLIALDALTGRPCDGFGRDGEVKVE